MDHFAGLDVSVKETSICIVDDAGKIVREVKVASEPDALLAVLKRSPACRRRSDRRWRAVPWARKRPAASEQILHGATRGSARLYRSPPRRGTARHEPMHWTAMRLLNASISASSVSRLRWRMDEVIE